MIRARTAALMIGMEKQSDLSEPVPVEPGHHEHLKAEHGTEDVESWCAREERRPDRGRPPKHVPAKASCSFQRCRRIRRADRARSQVRADKRINIQLGMTSMAPSRKQCHPQ
jgi:hypothetical protein